MNLKTALELGYECGLDNVGDAILNIRMRIGQLWDVDEYNELVDSYKQSGADLDDNLDMWLEKLK